MRLTGGRRAGAARSGTSTAAGLAALVATVLLAGCSGADSPTPEATETSSSAYSAEGDPREAMLAALLRRLDLSFDDPSSYTFTTRSTGTYVATARGEGNLRETIAQHTSSWRLQAPDGVDRFRFAMNGATGAYVGSGLPPSESPRFVEVNGETFDVVEAVNGPGADSLPAWTDGIDEVADQMSDIDLDPDGTGDTVAFTLPTRRWLSPDEVLPPGIDATTDYELTFDGEELVRIEALRDDTIVTTRIEHGPYRGIALPAVARQGP
ncbi:hypothetical protein G7072_06440 [Nocardioides sp. HDW12B]|uniref:hypothetical protein n=1 Tax=Nocardioides sp. HDW12B TaxID=2714939 RepID=UPI00140C15F1|nr:hypothetical protein [Nocardioides sp. HDW12B]QIK66025.1 hypothetical protein G7072_06440 [Nocardioides sp. HDW12B]